MKYIDNIPIWGKHEENTIEQAKMCAKYADYMALMADGHLGYGVPIGGVIAAEGRISPTAVGFDIACGNKAVRLDVPAQYVRDNIETIMDQVFSVLSFGIGRKNDERVDFSGLEGNAGWLTEAAKPLFKKAEEQLGTIGSGNHYVDIFADEQDRVWIGVHFGSRGLGHGIATWFLKACGAQDGMMVAPVFLDVDSDLGAQYVAAMGLGGAYAYAGRDWVCDRVAKIIGGSIVESIHNHHNFAWQEEHFGKKMWVCRKGATPAFPGQKGFVGGTMTEQAVILEGAATVGDTNSLQQAALYSTVHGAGRVMGRKEATGVIKRNKETGEMRVVREPKITQEMMDGAVNNANVVLRGAGVDESPFVYKRLPEVLYEQGDTVRILHSLTPLGVAMAGKDIIDPFKD
jgi:tRNA-splicing ligase RtcB (3'-phosphate/5'-hydroxy nucleic acid ligase)